MSETNVSVKKKPFFSRLKDYLKSAKSDLKKVTWPSKGQLKNNTIIILTFIILIGLFLFAFDSLFAWLTSLLTGIL